MSNQNLLSYIKTIIGNDVSNDIVSYIKSIKQEEDLAEFFENWLNKDNKEHVNSYQCIQKIIIGKKANVIPETSNSHVFKNGQQKSNVQKKGKTKFRDINKFQEKKQQEEGRRICDCLGQEHEFINNCMVCGRIHCMQEGPGPCLFCGNQIYIRGEEVFEGKRQRSVIKPKENKVFDDDNDYFKINAKKKDNNDVKRKMVIALDFATRKVIESSEEDEKIRRRLLKDSVEHLKKVEQLYKEIQKNSEHSYERVRAENANEDLVQLLIQMRHKKPKGIENLLEEDSSMPIIEYKTRIFDEDVMMNTDHGLCLSMHQPYASLLVAGVKKHEGRTWPTTHRGKLWIAAAAKVPDDDEIEALESYYREYYHDPSLKFPRDYPTSCLLGCIFVEDCLDQESYMKQYPNGESNSPYVLICSSPKVLPIFYPIIGKHKIYNLDKDIHKCAKAALQHANYDDL